MVRVYLACSLDGFIAGPNDDLSWLDPLPGTPAVEGGLDFLTFLESVGSLLMGRRTLDVVLGFEGPWPYGDRPVVVATHRPLPPHPAPLLGVQGDIHDLVRQAKVAAGDRHVYLDGAQLIREALNAGLVDEMVLTIVPITLGDGVRLFDGWPARQRFDFGAAVPFGQGMLQVVVTPKPRPSDESAS